MKKGGFCYVCGDPATSTDHAPPKGCFPTPRPGNLLTVRACKKHNEDRSMDDEYFIFFVASTCSEDPREGRVMNERVYPSLEKSEGYREMMADSMHYCLPQFGKNGIIKGVGIGAIIDIRRIQRVVDAIVRALYFKMEGKPLPQTCPIGNLAVNPTLPQEFLSKLPQVTPRGTTDGTFVARVVGFTDLDDAAFIHMTFFDRLVLFTGYGCIPRRSELEIEYLQASLKRAAPCGSKRCSYGIRAGLIPTLRQFFEEGGTLF